MLRVCSVLFAIVLVSVGWFIVTTTPRLPDPVATHFGNGYLANGFMARNEYRSFSLSFSTLLPLVVAGLLTWLPRRFPQGVNLANKEYWLAAERSAATFASITVRAVVLGTLLSIFMGGVHWLILQANATVPPRLSASAFWAMLIAFLVLVTVWIGAFWSKFRNINP